MNRPSPPPAAAAAASGPPPAARAREIASPVVQARGMFRMFRFFSLASLVCILIAGVALVLFFRHIAVREIVEFGESNNSVLAEAALNAMRPELLAFLDKTQQAEAAEGRVQIPGLLAHELDDLMRLRSVARIKIYNRSGRVVYATRTGAIGRLQADNPGFIYAMQGQVSSKLIYRDAFNAFDHVTEDDNLIQTYVPIAAAPETPPQGVLELYVDVDPLVRETERAQWQIIGGALVIMASLYFALLFVVRHAERLIEMQQQAIRERNLTLETLSARMLTAQEDEKKKIAFDLHERIAQTLSAVKLSVESAARQLAARGAGADAMTPMVQAVKEAINDVREVALNLRPSSLDELGLIATIRWFCREYARVHPDVVLAQDLRLAEDEVAEPLKIIVYRVMEEACREIGEIGAGRIGVGLAGDAHSISLSIDWDGGADADLAAARERTLLSGGYLETLPQPGGRRLRATWLR